MTDVHSSDPQDRGPDRFLVLCAFPERRFPECATGATGRDRRRGQRRGGGVPDDARLRHPLIRCRPAGGGGVIRPAPRAWPDSVEANDAFVITSPEYNFSIPGALKNSIDWVSRFSPQPFNEKHGLLMSASPSMAGGNRGLWALRVPFEHLGARLYPDMFSLARAHEAFDPEGRIASRELQGASRGTWSTSWTRSKPPSTIPASSVPGSSISASAPIPPSIGSSRALPAGDRYSAARAMRLAQTAAVPGR